MKRLLACSDIHGQYDQFIELLEKARYNPDKDQLILLGDYIDRGPKSRQVLDKVIELVEKDGAIALKGNHDQMMIDYCGLTDRDEAEGLGEDSHWIYVNGGLKTLESYGIRPGMGDDHGEMMRHAIWMKRNLKLYHEDKRCIFVHGGVRPHMPIDRQREVDLLWIRHNSFCGLGKTIVHGHTPVKEVTQIHDQIFIDTGSVFGGKLTMLELPSGEIFEV